jgi:hypothetical protein
MLKPGFRAPRSRNLLIFRQNGHGRFNVAGIDREDNRKKSVAFGLFLPHTPSMES